MNKDKIIKIEQDQYRLYLNKLKESRFQKYPALITFSSFTKCNAGCDFCTYTDLETKGEKMSDELLDKMINDLSDIPKDIPFRIAPYNVNEPLMDKRFFEIIEKIEQKLVNAKIELVTNGSLMTEDKFRRINRNKNVSKIGFSFNSHIKDDYERVMKLNYEKTVARIDKIHEIVEKESSNIKIVITKVSENKNLDDDYITWVLERWPQFYVAVIPRGDWLGLVDTYTNEIPELACSQWYSFSILPSGKVAFCCADPIGDFEYGDVNKEHILDIYNRKINKELREKCPGRKEVDFCKECSFIN